MGWNRPREREEGPGKREEGKKKSPFRGFVAGVIVVIGAGIAAWWIWTMESATRRGAAGTVGEAAGTVEKSTLGETRRDAASTEESAARRGAAGTVAVAADGTKDNPFNIAEVLNVKTNLQFGKIYTKVRRKDG